MSDQTDPNASDPNRDPDIDELSVRLLHHFLYLLDRSGQGSAQGFVQNAFDTALLRFKSEHLDTDLAKRLDEQTAHFSDQLQGLEKIIHRNEADGRSQLEGLKSRLDRLHDAVAAALKQEPDGHATPDATMLDRPRPDRDPAGATPEPGTPSSTEDSGPPEQRDPQHGEPAQLQAPWLTEGRAIGILAGVVIIVVSAYFVLEFTNGDLFRDRPAATVASDSEAHSATTARQTEGQSAVSANERLDQDAEIFEKRKLRALQTCNPYDTHPDNTCRTQLLLFAYRDIIKIDIFLEEESGKRLPFVQQYCANDFEYINFIDKTDWMTRCKRYVEKNTENILFRNNLLSIQMIASSIVYHEINIDALIETIDKYKKSKEKIELEGCDADNFLESATGASKIDGKYGNMVEKFLKSSIDCMPTFDGFNMIKKHLNNNNSSMAIMFKPESGKMVYYSDPFIREMFIFLGHVLVNKRLIEISDSNGK